MAEYQMAQEQRKQRMEHYASLHTMLNNVILCIELKHLADAEKFADQALVLLMRLVEMERDDRVGGDNLEHAN